MNIKQLKEVIDKLFTDRLPYMSLLQEIALNFYPERADFTVTRSMGTNFAEDLMSSYPITTRRTLGDQIGVMLRPTDKDWFKIVPKDPDREDYDARRWLEHKAAIMRRYMYDRRSKFTKSTKQGDHDFAAFGECVLSVRPNKYMDGLLYRNWHIRDCVWMENEEDEIGLFARKWKPTVRELLSLFPGKVSDKIEQMHKNNKVHDRIGCYHILCEVNYYDEQSNGKKYFSIYYDYDNNKIMECVPTDHWEYIVPRWQTVSGSQYAFSPATITALPDARLIQAMAYTLLEAGEKATNPPMIATEDAVRSDVSIFAGGITWVDNEYDWKTGHPLEPLKQDIRGFPFGLEMVQDSRTLLAEAFYLNKLTIPERALEMTAFEVGQRVQEYIRGALPIFEPMEVEYNGGICEPTFELLMRLGAFGSAHDIPESLQGEDVDFRFESPLHDAIDQQKGQKFLETKELITQAMEIDQQSIYLIDTTTAVRDALNGIGVETEWLNSELEVEEMQRERQREEETAAQLANEQQAANVAATAAQAQQAAVNQ